MRRVEPNLETLSIARASHAISSASNAVGKAEESKHCTDDARKALLHSIVCDLERLEMTIEDLLVGAAEDQAYGTDAEKYEADDDAEWEIVEAALEIAARTRRI